MSLESKAKSLMSIRCMYNCDTTCEYGVDQEKECIERHGKFVTLEDAQKLEVINKNMAECNQFRAEQIENLQDKIDNYKGMQKATDANILKLADSYNGLNRVHTETLNKIAEADKIVSMILRDTDFGDIDVGYTFKYTLEQLKKALNGGV